LKKAAEESKPSEGAIAMSTSAVPGEIRIETVSGQVNMRKVDGLANHCHKTH
jgi:hypothetical protein